MGVERRRAIPRTGDMGRADRHPVRRRDIVTVRAADRVRRDDAVQFVAGGILTVMASAVTAREAEESHRGHTGGTEYHAKNVEVHRSRLIKDGGKLPHDDVASRASAAQSDKELAP